MPESRNNPSILNQPEVEASVEASSADITPFGPEHYAVTETEPPYPYEKITGDDVYSVIADGITGSLSKNFQLSDVQKNNIGQGISMSSPFSAITGRTNNNIGFDRINQAFTVILETAFEEVPMLPILGSNLGKLLFDPIDDLMATELQDTLTEALYALEPRAEIIVAQADLSKRDQNRVDFLIEYRLTNTNIVHQFRYSIITGNGGDTL